MRKLATGLLLAVVLLTGYVAAGPFVAMQQIRSGVEQHDADRIAAHVDFPELRYNLRQQLMGMARQRVQSQMGSNPFAALAMGFADMLVDNTVNAIVTPAGLARVLAGEGAMPEPAGTSHASPAPAATPAPAFHDARFSYESPGRFLARVKNAAGEEVCFVFSREGFAWKLSNIVFAQQG